MSAFILHLMRHGATALTVFVVVGFWMVPISFATGALPEPVTGPNAPTEVSK